MKLLLRYDFLKEEHHGQIKPNYPLYKAVRKDMKDSNFPLDFWDYCVERQSRINNLTARNTFQLHGSNPHTALTGDEGDISNICQFKWYYWCYFRDRTEPFSFN